MTVAPPPKEHHSVVGPRGQYIGVGLPGSDRSSAGKRGSSAGKHSSSAGSRRSTAAEQAGRL